MPAVTLVGKEDVLDGDAALRQAVDDSLGFRRIGVSPDSLISWSAWNRSFGPVVSRPGGLLRVLLAGQR